MACDWFTTFWVWLHWNGSHYFAYAIWSGKRLQTLQCSMLAALCQRNECHATLASWLLLRCPWAKTFTLIWCSEFPSSDHMQTGCTGIKCSPQCVVAEGNCVHSPPLQMGQHWSGSYSGSTHSVWGQAATEHNTSPLGSHLHFSHGDTWIAEK